MATIPPQVRAFIDQCGQLGWVATVDGNGMPNVSPRFVVEVGPDYIAWGNSFTNKTFHNMHAHPQAKVGFADYGQRTGYELSGPVLLVDSGPIFERVCQLVEQKGFPRARKVSVMTVEEIRSLAG